MQLPDEKKCPRCGETKPKEEFGIWRCNGRLVISFKCKLCHAEYQRERKYERRHNGIDGALVWLREQRRLLDQAIHVFERMSDVGS